VNRYQMQMAPRWWSPQLNGLMVKLWRPVRVRKQVRNERLMEVTVRGAERVRTLLEEGRAVLITPNHPTHADAYSVYAAADEIGVPLYLMTAWQVFSMKSALTRQVLRWHGCFSVDREAADMRAFRQAVEVLERRREPLVVFPEGEVYHCNGRVRPFREGAAAIALSAAKRDKRPVVCVPCALWYEYLDDPTEELKGIMNDLEREVLWRPRTDLPLHERIYRFAEVCLVIKELEFLGRACEGPLPGRILNLADKILRSIEARRGLPPRSGDVPERVKELRHVAIQELEKDGVDEPTRKRVYEELEDLFLAVQLFSYPGDYVAEKPTVERMAETLDKFEEDVLNRFSATVRGRRRVTAAFGEPIPVERPKDRKSATVQLTELLETSVQRLIDQLSGAAPGGR